MTLSSVELYPHPIESLEDAIRLERLRMEKIYFSKYSIESTIATYLSITVDIYDPKNTPKDFNLFYNVASDVLFRWEDESDLREPEAMRWTCHRTRASKFSYILRFRRQEWTEAQSLIGFEPELPLGREI